MKKLFVGNLPWSATEGDVASLFADVGEVLSVRVVADRETGRSRGFAFVELDDEVAARALEQEFELEGRTLRVNEAEERAPRSGGGGFGGGGGGFGGGGGGRGPRGGGGGPRGGGGGYGGGGGGGGGFGGGGYGDGGGGGDDRRRGGGGGRRGGGGGRPPRR